MYHCIYTGNDKDIQQDINIQHKNDNIKKKLKKSDDKTNIYK